ncbi:antibiotic biosynthesis monooxygenase [Nannocystis sp. ILAH1]|uniref:putative quinol monooxygenase n=1 Tax=Nannocystis sp. ILAH1 TaxID=2996789 RepID=UPI00226F448C|nr:antibiotic biosynthesis monooxygenase family protein [Nannocystis sp. ILAH1]MCY0993135.1 antibiotic biosynthesis monooxygenase [Nannocystis sp. ILAH1]
MIRVMYGWKVKPGQEEAFAAAWGAVTRWSRVHAPGARGSLLVRGAEDPHEFVGVARWTSRAAWEAYQASDRQDPELLAHAQVMRATSERSRPAAFFDEVSDLTLRGEGERADGD